MKLLAVESRPSNCAAVKTMPSQSPLSTILCSVSLILEESIDSIPSDEQIEETGRAASTSSDGYEVVSVGN